MGMIYKPGEAVQLKSGGPGIVVEQDDPKKLGHVICEWFDGTKHKRKSFLEISLQRYDDTPLGPSLG